MNPVRTIITILLLTVLLGGLSGCGNKGPLYLPEPAEEQENGQEQG